MVFKNTATNTMLSHFEFVCFVWEETEKQYVEKNTNTNWCDLTKEEQLLLYCRQYEHQLNNMNWVCYYEDNFD